MKRFYVTVILLLFLSVSVGYADAPNCHARAGAYQIRINKQQNVVTIYKKKDGKYKPYKAFTCSTGYATPTGSFPLGEKMRWHQLMGPSYGQYCTRVYRGILLHSVWYYSYSKDSQSCVQYNRLGTKASHGCIRLTVADAKWIYDNCPSGTKVTIYNSADPGPLGKPKTVKVSGYTGWDPTDPDKNNPYMKKQPQIAGVRTKKVTLSYGSKKKLHLLRGVTAKNSFGSKMKKKQIKVDIQYREPGKKAFKRVQKINTKKPGTYRVIYRVTDILRHRVEKKRIFKVKKPKNKKRTEKTKTDPAGSKKTEPQAPEPTQAPAGSPVPEPSQPAESPAPEPSQVPAESQQPSL